MEVQEVIERMTQITKDKPNIIEQYKSAMVKRAVAQRNYDKAYAKKIMELKSKHPATLVREIAKGDVADQKYNLDDAEINEKAFKIVLNRLESEMSALQSILGYYKLEYQNINYGGK